MFAKLTALVSGAPSLPFEFDENKGERFGFDWKHFQATLKADKTSVSVFRFAFTSGHDIRKTEAARHGVKSLRTLRHPNVLIFKDSIEIEEKNSTSLYLVTEPVRLLTTVLEEDELNGQQKNAYLAMGLKQVTCAVSFLNNDCQQVHGNVCLSSILVSQNMDWKLSGFEFLSNHGDLSSSVLRDGCVFLKDVYKCPEMVKQDWESLKNGPPWAIDSWGLGCLIREVFGNGFLDTQASLRQTDCIPEDLLKDYQRLLSTAGTKRLNPQRLMKNKFLNNHLVEVVNFLESLAVKEATEKSTFFKKLAQNLVDLPSIVIYQKILPMVIDALEFGSASPNALGCVMKIAEEMNEDQFQTSIVPAITRFFGSNDRTIRRVLLENIEKFGNRLSSSLIDEKIYPALSNGFSDSNAYLRELTLKSMQHFAPKLSQKTLNQSLLKFLARLQVDQEPSIRANTTVLLGFIADHLGEASCKRILLNAFGRALKDPFPPARIAALKAFIVTKKYYDPVEVANKVIPSVSPLCIDGVDDVKKNALKVMDVFIIVLKEAADTSELTSEAQPSENKSSAQGYVSWAVSSLGFAPSTQSETKILVENEKDISSRISSPLKLNEERSQSSFQEATERFVSEPSSEEDKWEEFDDDVFDKEPEVIPQKPTPPPKPSPNVEKTRQNVEEKTNVAKPKQTIEEEDVWSDLGMKASIPTETSQRRRTKGTSKPLKLGAKKLNAD